MVVPNSAPRSAPKPVTQLSGVLLDSVLHLFGAVAYLAEMPVDLPHHRFPAMPEFAGDSERAHRHPLRAEKRSAVRRLACAPVYRTALPMG
jgi:hypothetical protein